MVELASPSDEGARGVSALRQKMELYHRNGAQFGWLLHAERAVEIWRGDGARPPERLQPATVLDVGDLFPGLGIDMEEVWAD